MFPKKRPYAAVTGAPWMAHVQLEAAGRAGTRPFCQSLTLGQRRGSGSRQIGCNRTFEAQLQLVSTTGAPPRARPCPRHWRKRVRPIGATRVPHS